MIVFLHYKSEKENQTIKTVQVVMRSYSPPFEFQIRLEISTQLLCTKISNLVDPPPTREDKTLSKSWSESIP